MSMKVIESVFREHNDSLQERLEMQKTHDEKGVVLRAKITKFVNLAAGKIDNQLEPLANTAGQQAEEVDEIIDGLKRLAQHREKKVLHKASMKTESERTRHSIRMSHSFKKKIKPVDDDEDEDPPDFPCLWDDITDSSPLGMVVNSVPFDMMCAGVIMMNAMFIGYSAQFSVEHIDDERSYMEYDVIDAAECGFLIFYCVELTLKLYTWRMRFFYNQDYLWNVFDFVLVMMGINGFVVKMQAGSKSSSNATWLRLLRLIKMVKLLRCIRVLRAFTELRIILSSFISSLRALFWTLVMLLLVCYIFGLCFLGCVTTWFEEEAKNNIIIDPTVKKLAEEQWGSLGKSMLTLYMVVTGGIKWRPVMELLKETASVHDQIYPTLFLFYITILSFAFLNVFTGMFIERARNTVLLNKRAVAKEELGSNQSVYHDIGVALKHAEVYPGGGIKWKAFSKALNKDQTLAALEAAEIPTTQAIELFRILSSNFRLTVQPKDFVDCCARLNSAVACSDMASLNYKFKKLATVLRPLMQYVEDSFNDLQAMFEAQGVASKVVPLKKRLAAARGEPEERPKKTKKTKGKDTAILDQEMATALDIFVEVEDQTARTSETDVLIPTAKQRQLSEASTMASMGSTMASM